jgi:ATP-dependent DNA ligase
MFSKKITLYRSSGNKTMIWKITLQSNGAGEYIICVTRGQLLGKLIEDKPCIIQKGKAGRTPKEQALLKFNSMVSTKLDRGYTENTSGVDDNSPFLPMLAQNYEKHNKKIIFPALVQPKLDGVRCLAKKVNGEILLYSRKGKVFQKLEHIKNSINLKSNITLDGELFSEKLDFQRVVGLVRKKKINEKDIEDMKHIKYNIFDLFDDNNDRCHFCDRWEQTKLYESKTVKIVPTFEVKNEDDIKKYLSLFLQKGDEGVIIRNKHSIYEKDKRSYNLQKYKKFLDSEYKIVDAVEATGNDKGTVIWVCETQESGKSFKVRPIGNRDKRKEYFLNREKYFGKYLTVKYQELTNDKIPRFPVGLEIRDYE